MLKTVKEVLRLGNGTIKYPFAPVERPEYARGKPEHDSITCMACGACAVACPPNAIQMVTDMKEGTISWTINYGRCIYCGRCEESCPTAAIKLSPEFELAVMNKADLEEICSYSLQKCVECGKQFAPKKEVEYASRILSQSLVTSDEDIQTAVGLLKICPSCKLKKEAYAAKSKIDAREGNK